MIPFLIWVAAVLVIVVAYILGPKAMLVGFVLLLLIGVRTVWDRPKRPR